MKAKWKLVLLLLMAAVLLSPIKYAPWLQDLVDNTLLDIWADTEIMSVQNDVVSSDINQDGYHDGDVAAIHAMIDNNGLSAEKGDVEGWAELSFFLEWNSENPKRIVGLSLSGKYLTGMLDVSALTGLTSLDCYENQLTEILGLGNLTGLRVLNCGSNDLTELLGLGSLTELLKLHCYNNQLTELEDLSRLTKLEELVCYNNQLTELTGLSGMTSLFSLYCDNNRLTELDASHLTSLTGLHCIDNPLTSLTLVKKKFVKKNKLTIGSTEGGTVMLTDIQYLLYDDKADSVELTATPEKGYAFQTWQAKGTTLENAAANPVAFPLDRVITITPVFVKQAAVPNDSNNDGYHDGDVAAINNIIQENGLSARQDDPAGWAGSTGFVTWNEENRRRITSLSIENMELTGTLDISSLTSLTSLMCQGNQLTELKGLGRLTSLTSLYCQNNKLTELEGLGRLTSLTALCCQNNQLTELEGLGRLTSLTTLYCQDNRLTALDLSPLTGLLHESWDNNPLTFMKISNDIQLTVGSAAGGEVMMNHYNEDINLIVLTATPNTSHFFQEWQINNTQPVHTAVNPGRFTLEGNLTITPVFMTEANTYYTDVIKEGDTLWGISRRYGITLLELMDVNPHIKDPDFILAGWEINIP